VDMPLCGIGQKRLSKRFELSPVSDREGRDLLLDREAREDSPGDTLHGHP
jgi:hypothetical protein